MLGLLPLRDWLYIGAIVGLLVALGIFAHHERSIQAAKDRAADERVAHAAEIHNAEVETRAKTVSDKALADYVAAHAVPTLPAPRIVCFNTPSNRAVPSAASAAAGGDAAARIPEEATGPPFDPAAAVLADGRDADAQVKLLQDLIRSYQKAGVVAKQ